MGDCRSCSLSRGLVTACYRRTAAARRQAETLLERPVFGVKRPLSNAGEFAVRAAGQCAEHVKDQPPLRGRRIEGFGQATKPATP
jgi:hypothetical protein